MKRLSWSLLLLGAALRRSLANPVVGLWGARQVMSFVNPLVVHDASLSCSLRVAANAALHGCCLGVAFDQTA